MTMPVSARTRLSALWGSFKDWLATPPGFTLGYASLTVLSVLFFHTTLRPRVPALLGSRQPLVSHTAIVVLSTALVYGLSRHSHTRLREATNRLGRQSDLITVLLRALRHNLRNRITVIRGHLDAVVTADGMPLENVTPMQEAIDKLLTLSEQARQLESIVAVETDTRYVDLTAMVRDIADQLEAEYPSADITVEQRDSIAVGARPTLEYAVRELMTNAVKHGGDDASVSVALSRSYLDGQRGLDGVELAVTDTGPGLPENERQVLHEGAEEPLIHGSGLGLYQVYLVVDRHGGSIETTVTDDGTRIVVSLPNAQRRIADDVEVTTGRGHTQFKAVFDQSPDAMALVDETRQICTANARLAAMVGVSQTRLVGQQLDSFLALPTESPEWWQAVDGAPGSRGTVALVDADGREKQVTCRVRKNVTAGQHLVVITPAALGSSPVAAGAE